MYSFFFLRHSLAASLFFRSRISRFRWPVPVSSPPGDPRPEEDPIDDIAVGTKNGPPFSGFVVYWTIVPPLFGPPMLRVWRLSILVTLPPFDINAPEGRTRIPEWWG
eukprot:TRINITY_DN15080_c1_g1_i1.p1 TRINITY_DN15080_c1_g1~~TRINITY_DN15080_c1_g1_i1.p1  ORF type:complete len:107 (-),score=5.17 TRINITY_DN15080_c1_g1_i1:129-449(-)